VTTYDYTIDETVFHSISELRHMTSEPRPHGAQPRQDLFFAFIYNRLGVHVAARVFYPFFGILLSPMLAADASGFAGSEKS